MEPNFRQMGEQMAEEIRAGIVQPSGLRRALYRLRLQLICFKLDILIAWDRARLELQSVRRYLG